MPSNALFVLTALYLLMNLFSLTVAVSFVSGRTRRLTQECAILRAIDLLRGGIQPGAHFAREMSAGTPC